MLKLNDQEFRYVHFGNRADFNNVVAFLAPPGSTPPPPLSINGVPVAEPPNF